MCVCVSAERAQSRRLDHVRVTELVTLFLRVWEEIRSHEGNIVWDFRSFEGEREQRV